MTIKQAAESRISAALPGYHLYDIRQYSAVEDSWLYSVIATNGKKFIYWSSFSLFHGLNGGHYDLTEKQAKRMLAEDR
jgi:hypothetical protein